MSRPTFAARLAKPFVVFVERYYPDPFVFLILLTLLAFGFAIALTPTTGGEALVAWGDGLAGLLAFMAQIVITLITAHALAHTDGVSRGLAALARLPQSVSACYTLVVLCACAASLLAWSFGLVTGALLARAVAVQAAQRGLKVHYPLLVTAAYCGLVVWHMGYSGSAPLSVATPGHALSEQIGLLPVTQTLFAYWNLVAIVLTVAVLAYVCPRLHPADAEVRPATADVLTTLSATASAETQASAPPATWGARMDAQRGLTLVFGALLAAYLGQYFYRNGFALNLNIVNWSFLAFGLLLARSPAHYVQLVLNAGQTVGAVLIQYPFYAGIMGLMAGSGLVELLAGWFTQISSAQTLGFWAFLAGGLVNLFIPSGGGQWAVQGPVFLQAAQQLGTDPAIIVMGIAYGDQWTNLIQPFWTIPLLAIAGLRMRDIMGYCFVLFLVSGLSLGGAILYAGFFA